MQYLPWGKGIWESRSRFRKYLELDTACYTKRKFHIGSGWIMSITVGGPQQSLGVCLGHCVCDQIIELIIIYCKMTFKPVCKSSPSYSLPAVLNFMRRISWDCTKEKNSDPWPQKNSIPVLAASSLFVILACLCSSGHWGSVWSSSCFFLFLVLFFG